MNFKLFLNKFLPTAQGYHEYDEKNNNSRAVTEKNY